jgi:hypothetical protein
MGLLRNGVRLYISLLRATKLPFPVFLTTPAYRVKSHVGPAFRPDVWAEARTHRRNVIGQKQQSPPAIIKCRIGADFFIISAQGGIA